MKKTTKQRKKRAKLQLAFLILFDKFCRYYCQITKKVEWKRKKKKNRDNEEFSIFF